MSAAWPQFLMDASIVGLIRGYACRNRGSNFYVLLISSIAPSEVKWPTGQDVHTLVRPCIPIALPSESRLFAGFFSSLCSHYATREVFGGSVFQS